jgi:hypothetical protein
MSSTIQTQVREDENIQTNRMILLSDNITDNLFVQ